MSFQNLTIGKKITLGFALIFTLLVFVAAIGYNALGGAGQRFHLFAGSALDTTQIVNGVATKRDAKDVYTGAMRLRVAF